MAENIAVLRAGKRRAANLPFAINLFDRERRIMARSTRGDSSRDTTSRPTSRRPSTETANTRGAASSGTQSTSRGGQNRSASPAAETTTRGGQTAQPNTTAPSSQASQSSAQDRERSIETRDESGRTQGQPTGAGVSRRQGTAPVFGGSGAFGNPFAAMRRWSEDMDRLFQDFGFGQFGIGRSPLREIGALGGPASRENEIGDWSPQVEAFQRGDKFVVRADLPGMNKDDVKVEVENNMLTISGERTDEREENGEGFYRSERSYGQFYRAIPLPEGVSADQCDATFKDGVLEVSLKAPQQREKSRQIPIR